MILTKKEVFKIAATYFLAAAVGCELLKRNPPAVETIVYDQKLSEEFSKKVSDVHAEGLAEFKMKLRIDEATTTAGIAVVLDNTLRLRREGKMQAYVKSFC